MQSECEDTISNIEFIIDEFWSNPIKDGPLKGEPNPSLAIGKIVEIAECVKVYRDQNTTQKRRPRVPDGYKPIHTSLNWEHSNELLDEEKWQDGDLWLTWIGTWEPVSNWIGSAIQGIGARPVSIQSNTQDDGRESKG